MPSDVVLIHPPFWDPYGPPAATAALVGHLRANQVAAKQIDLNQGFFADQYATVVDTALTDLADPDAFGSLVPHEHKVVLGIQECAPDLLERHGIDESDLTLARHRRAIATWDIQRLNVLDAIVHYGYFVRHDPDLAKVLTEPDVLAGPAWGPLKRSFETRCLPLLGREQPLVVGFSLLGEQQLAPAIALTHWLRQAGFDGLVVWGGSDIRYTHDRCTRPESWWRTLPDALCLGEGESAILQLTRRARTLRDTFGPDWRSHLELARNPRDDTFIAGLVGQPFERTLLPAKRYERVNTLAQYDFDGFDLHEGYLMPWPIVPYQGSRGCHWGICGFCDHEEGYRLHYRPKTAEQVVDHMEDLRDRFGVTHLQFVDEAIEPQWLRDLNDELDHRSLSGVFRWSNYSKIAKEVTPDLLAHSYRNGCRLILFGVESFNQRVLNVVRKGTRRADIFRTLTDVHAAGIRSWVWLISGLPTQNVAEVRRDIADLRSLAGVVDAASVGRYRISANSDIFRETEKFGIVSLDLDHPMDLTYRIDGETIPAQDLARVFHEEYYPAAIDLSVSHNRYLLYADAIKNERSAASPPRPNSTTRALHPWQTADATQHDTRAGLGNI
jgi:hypothetical protein